MGFFHPTRILLPLAVGLLAGCQSTCDEIDKELGEVLVSHVPAGTTHRCGRPGDCVSGMPISRFAPRASGCPVPINREAAFGLDRYRADGRVIALMAKARKHECRVEEPACVATEFAGCVDGFCAYKMVGCTGDDCLVVPRSSAEY